MPAGRQETLRLRYQLALAVAKTRSERGAGARLASRLAAAESEIQRLSQSLGHAQTHIDGLLQHAETMERRLAATTVARQIAETAAAEEHRTNRALEARLSAIETELNHYQSIALCRWLARHRLTKGSTVP